jgi:hypothetical protein
MRCVPLEEPLEGSKYAVVEIGKIDADVWHSAEGERRQRRAVSRRRMFASAFERARSRGCDDYFVKTRFDQLRDDFSVVSAWGIEIAGKDGYSLWTSRRLQSIDGMSELLGFLQQLRGVEFLLLGQREQRFQHLAKLEIASLGGDFTESNLKIAGVQISLGGKGVELDYVNNGGHRAKLRLWRCDCNSNRAGRRIFESKYALSVTMAMVYLPPKRPESI